MDDCTRECVRNSIPLAHRTYPARRGFMSDHSVIPSTPPPAAPLAKHKVLFVTPVAPWNLVGGTPIVSRCLIELFTQTADVHVCCLRSSEPGEYPRTAPGATTLSGPVSGAMRKLKFFFDFSADSFAHRQFHKSAVRARFAALLAEQRPEFIIFDHIYSSWLIDLVEDAKARVVYVAHDDMVAYADSLLRLRPGFSKRLRFLGLRRQYRSLQEKIVRRSDFTLTMTPEDAALLRPAARGPVEVAPVFFGFPDFTREYPADFHSLLVTGSFDTWEKKLGLTQFLTTIFVPLVEQRPDIRLVVAGRISADVLRQMPFGEPRIRIVQAPSASELRETIQQASAAVVLDLQHSGLKIKTMELAASGLPLVSWAPGLEGTQLVPGRSALLATSPTEFLAHLARLSGEPELRQQLGTAARTAVHAEFSKSAARARLEKSALFAALAAAGAVRAA